MDKLYVLYVKRPLASMASGGLEDPAAQWFGCYGAYETEEEARALASQITRNDPAVKVIMCDVPVKCIMWRGAMQ